MGAVFLDGGAELALFLALVLAAGTRACLGRYP